MILVWRTRVGFNITTKNIDIFYNQRTVHINEKKKLVEASEVFNIL